MDAAARSRSAARGAQGDRGRRGRGLSLHQLQPGDQRDADGGSGRSGSGGPARVRRDGRRIGGAGLLGATAGERNRGRFRARASQARPSGEGSCREQRVYSDPETSDPETRARSGAANPGLRPGAFARRRDARAQRRAAGPSDDEGLPPRARAVYADLADASGGALYAGIPARPRAAFVSGNVPASRPCRRSDGDRGATAGRRRRDHLRRYPAAARPDGRGTPLRVGRWSR